MPPIHSVVTDRLYLTEDVGNSEMTSETICSGIKSKIAATVVPASLNLGPPSTRHVSEDRLQQ